MFEGFVDVGLMVVIVRKVVVMDEFKVFIFRDMCECVINVNLFLSDFLL